jgi:hypothetical protein
MKKTYYLPLVILLLVVSCTQTKDFYEQLGKGTTLTLVKQDNALLNAIDVNSTVSQVVSFNGEPVESINLYVSATSTTDKSKWKLIKNIPVTGETTVSATNTEIATALGLTPGAIPPGVTYYMYNEAVLKDGRKFSSANTSQGDLIAAPAFNQAFQWTATVVCPYTPSTTAGTYKVVTDEWESHPVGSDVVVTTGPGVNDINLSGVWPRAGGPYQGTVATPLTITVNPTTGAVTIPSGVTFANYAAFGGFTGITGVGSTGFVFSCTNTISITMRINAPPFGDQGFLKLVLKK